MTPTRDFDHAEQHLAPFLREMAGRFVSRQNNVFLLAGNVNDLIDGLGVACPPEATADPGRFVYIDRYIAARLSTRGRVVLSYNIARGIAFAEDAQRQALRSFYAAWEPAGPVEGERDRERRTQRFDRSMIESQAYSFLTLKFLEELCRLVRTHPAAAPGRLSIIVKHAETLLPDAPPSQLSEIDRQKLTLLREWFTDPDFVNSGEQIIMIGSTVAGFHGDLRSLPQVAAIQVPLPDCPARERFVAWERERNGIGVALPDGFSELTAGMTLLTIQSLLLKARHGGGTLGEAEVLHALNALLVSELGDKIETLRPAHRFSDVIGATALKKELERLRILLESRDPSVAPVGILVAGPNGVGKTFVFEAWAAECNRLVIVLKNLRGMYFGQTDQIFEKLRTVLEALGNVIIFIDEADTVFGKPGRDTHETEARLFGNMIRMMGDPKNRGRIVWILITARPDNLAPDLKRSGRAGLHLPVFDPEGPDRAAYLDFVLRRAGFDPATLTREQRARLDEATAELSPADFNEVLVELRAEKLIAGELDFDRLVTAVGGIMPGDIALQRRIQTLNALLECSRRSLIPDSLVSLGRAGAREELERLKRTAGL